MSTTPVSDMAVVLHEASDRAEVLEFAEKHEYRHIEILKLCSSFAPILPSPLIWSWIFVKTDAEDSYKKVGFYIFSVSPEQKRMTIVHMFVEPNFQRRGVGTAVVHNVQKTIRNTPFLFKEVFADCEPDVVPFYTHLGFVQLGVVPDTGLHDLLWSA